MEGGGQGGGGRLGERGGSEGLRDCVFVSVRVRACVDAGEGRDKGRYVMHYQISL